MIGQAKTYVALRIFGEPGRVGWMGGGGGSHAAPGAPSGESDAIPQRARPPNMGHVA